MWRIVREAQTGAGKHKSRRARSQGDWGVRKVLTNKQVGIGPRHKLLPATAIAGILATSLLLGATAAQASVVTYSDRTAFDAAVSAPMQTEYYEDEIADYPVTGNRTISLSNFDVSYVGDRQFGVGSTTILQGSQALNVIFPVESTTGYPDRLTFTFNTPMLAFGTDVYGVQGPSYHFKLYNGNTKLTEGAAMPDSNNTSYQFFGVVVSPDMAFTSIAFSRNATSGGDGWVIDSTSFAAAATTTPLPPSLALLGTGLGLIGFFRLSRKRRKQSTAAA